MKAIFGKWLPYFLALLGVEIILIFITVVWVFKDSGLKPVYDLFSRNPVVFNVLEFMADWAEAISGAIAIIALVILYIGFRKLQRSRAVNRLHIWARNGVVVLAQYRKETGDDADSPTERYGKVEAVLEKLMATSGQALSDASVLGGEIHGRTKGAVEGLRTIKVKLSGEDVSLFEDLEALQHDFADVMILAFEFIK
jgi:hypothetical protein